MPIRLFVGNIPHRLDEAGLTKAFEDAGVTITGPKIIRDRDTGQPRGFGFVELADGTTLPQAGAIVAMGRTLRIEMAQAQERRSSSTASRPQRSDTAPPLVIEESRRRKPERPGRGRNRRDRDVGGRW